MFKKRYRIQITDEKYFTPQVRFSIFGEWQSIRFSEKEETLGRAVSSHLIYVGYFDKKTALELIEKHKTQAPIKVKKIRFEYLNN